MKTNKIFSVAMVAVAMLAMTMTSCSKDDDATTGVKTNLTQTKGEGGKLTYCIGVTDQMAENMDLHLNVTDANGNTATSDIKASELKTFDEISKMDGADKLHVKSLNLPASSFANSKMLFVVKNINVASTPANYQISLTGSKKAGVDDEGTTDFVIMSPSAAFTQKGLVYGDQYNYYQETSCGVYNSILDDLAKEFKRVDMNVTISATGQIKTK